MVVIAILGLVIAILLVAIRSASGSAQRLETLSTLRQMSAAHASYATDHRQMLLPGYLNTHLQVTLGFTTQGPRGEALSPAVAGPYVWRLAPYLDSGWRTFHSGADAATMAALTSEFENGIFGKIAFEPSFGLNTIFIGGDSDAGGGTSEHSPWNSSGYSSIAATRLTHLRSPASLVLFAPTRRVQAGASPDAPRGWHELRAPFLQSDSAQWTATDQGVVAGPGLEDVAGLPALGPRETVLPAAFADGSAQPVDVESLGSDMRRWAPSADSPIWRVPQ